MTILAPSTTGRPAMLTAWLMRVSAWLPWLGLGCVALAYGLTVCRTVYNLDSAEFSVATATLGITRATGYPLYLLLGKLWLLLLAPLAPDAGFRLNLFSAFCACVSVVFTYHLTRRAGSGRGATLAAAGLLAFGYYFWAQAVAAEVYTLQTALMAGLLWLLWQAVEEKPHASAPRLNGLLAFAVLYGLSFGNHMASGLFMPAFLVYLAWAHLPGWRLPFLGRVWRLRGSLPPSLRFYLRRVALLALAFGAGLLVYAYLPLRYLSRPEFNYAGAYDSLGIFHPVDLTQLRGILWLVSGKTFQGLMFAYSPAEFLHELLLYARQLGAGFGVIGVVAGALGAVSLLRQRTRWGVLLLLVFLSNLLFFVDYRVIDKETMYLPTYLIWAIWAGAGLSAIQRWAGWQQTASRALSAIFLVAPALLLVTNMSLVDISHDARARHRGEAALVTAGQDALILGWWDSAPVLQYLQLVEGQRPDVQVINRFLISAPDLYSLLSYAVPRRPVYLTASDDGIASQYQVRQEGALYRVELREIDD